MFKSPSDNIRKGQLSNYIFLFIQYFIINPPGEVRYCSIIYSELFKLVYFVLKGWFLPVSRWNGTDNDFIDFNDYLKWLNWGYKTMFWSIQLYQELWKYVQILRYKYCFNQVIRFKHFCESQTQSSEKSWIYKLKCIDYVSNILVKCRGPWTINTSRTMFEHVSDYNHSINENH